MKIFLSQSWRVSFVIRMGFLVCLLALHSGRSTQAGELPPVAKVIVAEASRAANDADGRPLPLASSWDSGFGSWGVEGYPHYRPREEVKGKLNLHTQVRLIEAGHHWLPVSGFPPPALTKKQHPEGSTWFNFKGHYKPWDTIASWRLPVTFAGTQFEAPLYNQALTTDRWVKLPPSKNPNYIRADKVYRTGKLAAHAVATAAGSRTVRVTLPDASGIDASPRNRIWITQPVVVGGLEMCGERWPLTAVEGNVVTFTHAKEAVETAIGGNVPYEAAVVESVAEPMGPKAPWREVGTWWMTEYGAKDKEANGFRNLQARYPNPPRLIFLSNNEGRLLRAGKRNDSKRYVDAYGVDTEFFFGQEVFAKGYVERYKDMFAGMRSAMPVKWDGASKMVAYNAVFHWNYARSGGWWQHSFYFPDNMGYLKHAWEGASPEYYLNPWQGGSTDYTVFSPQVEFMNVKWQLDLVYKTHPDFWYEMSIWDGFQPKTPEPGKNKRAWYKSKDDPFTPARYKAWLQYGMWLTRPRVVREFRNTGSPLDDTGREYFNKFLEAVDDVHADPVKTRFWRHGSVVANPSRKHPYQQNTRPEYGNIPKWFNLNTNLDPPGSWGLTTEIPVWALALVIGEAPNREWLIYCYSPKLDRADVAITVPAYGELVVDVPQSGAFYYRTEKTDNE